jgi:hypothetical protein
VGFSLLCISQRGKRVSVILTRSQAKTYSRREWVFAFKAIKVYFEKLFKRKNSKTAKQFGFYAWNAHNAMDHEIILTRSQKLRSNGIFFQPSITHPISYSVFL